MSVPLNLKTDLLVFDAFLQNVDSQRNGDKKIVLTDALSSEMKIACLSVSQLYNSVTGENDKQGIINSLSEKLAGIVSPKKISETINLIIEELNIEGLAAELKNTSNQIDSRLDQLQADIMNELNNHLTESKIDIDKLFSINSNANKLEMLEWFSSYIQIRKNEKPSPEKFDKFIEDITFEDAKIDPPENRVRLNTTQQLIKLKDKINASTPFSPFVRNKFISATQSIPDIFLVSMDENNNVLLDITLATLKANSSHENNQLGRYQYIAKEYLKVLDEATLSIIGYDDSLDKIPNSISKMEAIMERANLVGNNELTKDMKKLPITTLDAYRRIYEAKNVFTNSKHISESKIGSDKDQEGDQDSLTSRINIKMFNMSRGILLFNDKNQNERARFIEFLKQNDYPTDKRDTTDEKKASYFHATTEILSHYLYSISQLSDFYLTNLNDAHIRGTVEELEKATVITNRIDNVSHSLAFKTETTKILDKGSSAHFFTTTQCDITEHQKLLRLFIGFLNTFKNDNEVFKFLGSVVKQENFSNSSIFLYFKQVLGKEPEFTTFIAKFPNVAGIFVENLSNKEETNKAKEKALLFQGELSHLKFLDPTTGFWTSTAIEENCFTSIFTFLYIKNPDKLDWFFQQTVSKIFFPNKNITNNNSINDTIIRNWKSEPLFLAKIIDFVHVNKGNFQDKKYAEIVKLLSTSDSKAEITNGISAIIPGFKP